MTKHWSPRKWRGLAPCIFFGIIDLNIVDWPIFRSSPDKIDIAVVIGADHGAIHWHWDVRGAVPTLAFGLVGIHVGHRDFISLPVHHISSKYKNLSLGPHRRRAQAAGNSRYSAALGPFPRREP